MSGTPSDLTPSLLRQVKRMAGLLETIRARSNHAATLIFDGKPEAAAYQLGVTAQMIEEFLLREGLGDEEMIETARKREGGDP